MSKEVTKEEEEEREYCRVAPESTALPIIEKNQQALMETSESSVVVLQKGDAKQSSPMKNERRGELPHYLKPTAASAAKQQPVTRREEKKEEKRVKTVPVGVTGDGDV